MPISQLIKTRIVEFEKAVRQLNNESSKTHHFFTLISSLFPGHKINRELSQGVEKSIRVQIGDDRKLRRIDLYRGNVIFEFENNLKKTRKEAEKQLKEYSAGTWGTLKKSNKPLVCVASDGLDWVQYRPFITDKAKKNKAENEPIEPNDVSLNEIRTLKLAKNTTTDFWFFLNSILFQSGVKEPSVKNLQWEFGVQSYGFSDTLESLKNSLNANRKNPHIQTQLKTWTKYTIMTQGSLPSDPEGLFLKQTYLSIISKIITWGYLSKGKHDINFEKLISQILSGEIFRKFNVENLGEKDFFSWVLEKNVADQLDLNISRIMTQILEYDLNHFEEDIFRGLYEELILVEERKSLGEYYTPDWLCDMVVEEALPNGELKTILDPSCGSGGFLRSVIKRIKHYSKDSPEILLHKLLNSIAGIDINPLAVSIAKATFLISLGELINHAKRPVQIPIYLANSLLPPQQVSQQSFLGKWVYSVPFANKNKAVFPDSLVSNSEIFERCIISCHQIAESHALKGKENKERLEKYIVKQIKDFPSLQESEFIIDCLWDFSLQLSDLIKKNENNIWSFVIRNAYRPAMLKGHFELIIGNPPWITLKDFQEKTYQDQIKSLCIEYSLSDNRSKLNTQLEIATLFSVHSLEYFGTKNSSLAFVIPRSIFSGDQHHLFRMQSFTTRFKVEKIQDLRQVKPIFNTLCCVLYAKKDRITRQSNLFCEVESYEGNLPDRNVPYEIAKNNLISKISKMETSYLGTHTALVDQGFGSKMVTRKSFYHPLFRQGATIVPRNSYFVSPHIEPSTLDFTKVYSLQTDLEQAKLAKGAYKEINISGTIEGNYIFYTILSNDLLPFKNTGCSTIVLPITMDTFKKDFSMLSPRAIGDKGDREGEKWFEKAQNFYAERSKGEDPSILDRLDYSKELTHQNTKNNFICLFKAKGTNISAMKIRRDDLNRFVADAVTYHYSSSNEDEIDFLTGVLNSNVVNKMIKPFQSVGLQGERDIHKLPLEIPIPKYAVERGIHVIISQVANEMSNKAKLIKIPRDTKLLANKRKFIRDSLKSDFKELDELVESLFKLHKII